MSRSLLTTRRFAPLFWCQFFAAFNDNFLKNAVVLLVLFHVGGAEGESVVTLAGAVFITPFFIFSSLGGQLADKFDKAIVARRLKFIEIGAAGVAVVGFQLRSIPLLFGALFLFGVLGALFGPVKYGILPDHLKREELPAGNAFVEGSTFLAILTGTIAGGLAMQDQSDFVLFSLGLMAIAIGSYAAACFIPSTTKAAPDLTIDANVLRLTFALMRELWIETPLWRAAVVVSVFWLIGAVALSLLPPLVKNVLSGSEPVITIQLAVFAIAIAIGSGLAAFLLRGKIVLWPTAVGATIIAIVCMDLGVSLFFAAPTPRETLLPPAAFFADPAAQRATADLTLLALAGGLMIVPSFTAIQAFSAPSARARVIAAVNVLNAAFMTFGLTLVAFLQSLGVAVPSLFIGVGAVTFATALWIFKAVVGLRFETSCRSPFGHSSD